MDHLFPFYSIAHQDFNWPLPPFMTVIGTGQYVPAQGLSLSRDFPHLLADNRYFGEYVALFAIRDLLRARGAEGMVGVCHYRRFALTRPVGTLRGFNYYAAPAVMGELQPEDFLGDGQTPMLSSAFDFGQSVLTQYSSNGNGNARDLLMFFGVAIDCGVISSMEAAQFLSRSIFVPVPTVAVLPVTWFLHIVDALELVMTRYFETLHIVREGYMERNLAFSAERLQSLLLMRLVADHGWDRVHAQPLILLAE